MSELQKIAVDARNHAENVTADITKTSTRIEYIRITQLAMEADRLATKLEQLAAAS
jgi:hypothetical protein